MRRPREYLTSGVHSPDMGFDNFTEGDRFQQLSLGFQPLEGYIWAGFLLFPFGGTDFAAG